MGVVVPLVLDGGVVLRNVFGDVWRVFYGGVLVLNETDEEEGREGLGVADAVCALVFADVRKNVIPFCSLVFFL